MNNIKIIKCRDHHQFTDYITNVITEIPRRTPVDNAMDIYVDDVVISIRSPLLYHIVTLTDSESTKTAVSRIYANSNRFKDSFFADYKETAFAAGQSAVLKYQNPNKIFSTKITADINSFISYMETALKFMESKPEKVLDYDKDDLHILILEYNAIPGYNYLITYIHKNGNPYFEINVVETNGLSKYSAESDKTPTKVKMEELINKYYSSINKQQT